MMRCLLKNLKLQRGRTLFYATKDIISIVVPTWLWYMVVWYIFKINTLRPRQNGRHFADDTFKCIFLNENVWILLQISLKFVPKGPINNIPALVQIMAWRRPGDKPLSELRMESLRTHICVTRPQWVKWYSALWFSVCFGNPICYISLTGYSDYMKHVGSALMSSQPCTLPKRMLVSLQGLWRRAIKGLSSRVTSSPTHVSWQWRGPLVIHSQGEIAWSLPHGAQNHL